jgi:hypothetical protein
MTRSQHAVAGPVSQKNLRASQFDACNPQSCYERYEVLVTVNKRIRIDVLLDCVHPPRFQKNLEITTFQRLALSPPSGV